MVVRAVIFWRISESHSLLWEEVQPDFLERDCKKLMVLKKTKNLS